MSASPLLPKSSKASVPPASSKLNSPSNTPAEALQNVGGMPPEKNENQINDANDPKKRGYAPGAVHGT